MKVLQRHLITLKVLQRHLITRWRFYRDIWLCWRFHRDIWLCWRFHRDIWLRRRVYRDIWFGEAFTETSDYTAKVLRRRVITVIFNTILGWWLWSTYIYFWHSKTYFWILYWLFCSKRLVLPLFVLYREWVSHVPQYNWNSILPVTDNSWRGMRSIHHFVCPIDYLYSCQVETSTGMRHRLLSSTLKFIDSSYKIQMNEFKGPYTFLSTSRSLDLVVVSSKTDSWCKVCHGTFNDSFTIWTDDIYELQKYQKQNGRSINRIIQQICPSKK